MAGVSTGISLLTSSGNRVMLTYATGIMSSRTRVATATPNPDPHGATGYSTTSTRGPSLSDDNFFVDLGLTGAYPNYTLFASIKPEYMGSQTGNIFPSIKDSAGISGNTSGSIPFILARGFGWGTGVGPTMPTSFSRTTTTNTQTMGIVFTTLEEFASANIDNYVIENFPHPNRQWNSLISILQDAGMYNEVKFENLSGDNAWSVTQYSSLSAPRSKNTYYNISDSAIICTARASAGTFTNGIRATFRNKADNTITFVKDFTMTITR